MDGGSAGTELFGFSSGQTRVGYTVGGGVEFAITPNWSVKGKALYANLGTATSTFVPALDNFFVGASFPNRFENSLVVVRAGLNYKFNWGMPAPLVARY